VLREGLYVRAYEEIKEIKEIKEADVGDNRLRIMIFKTDNKKPGTRK
jgi:hypothetical protein